MAKYYKPTREFKYIFEIHSTIHGANVRKQFLSADSEAQARKWIETYHLEEFEYIGKCVSRKRN